MCCSSDKRSAGTVERESCQSLQPARALQAQNCSQRGARSHRYTNRLPALTTTISFSELLVWDQPLHYNSCETQSRALWCRSQPSRACSKGKGVPLSWPSLTSSILHDQQHGLLAEHGHRSDTIGTGPFGKVSSRHRCNMQLNQVWTTAAGPPIFKFTLRKETRTSLILTVCY